MPLNESGQISIDVIVKQLQKTGFSLDNTKIFYKDPINNYYIFCGCYPLEIKNIFVTPRCISKNTYEVFFTLFLFAIIFKPYYSKNILKL